MMRRSLCRCLTALIAAVMLAGCAQAPQSQPTPQQEAEPTAAYTDQVEIAFLADEAVALAASPAALPAGFAPEASGTAVKKGAKAVIDYSHVKDGYVMVQ